MVAAFRIRDELKERVGFFIGEYHHYFRIEGGSYEVIAQGSEKRRERGEKV